jgi:hypothetical protein
MYTSHVPYVLFTGLFIYYTVKYTWSTTVSHPYTRYAFLVGVAALYTLYVCNTVFFDIGSENFNTNLIVIAIGIAIDLQTNRFPGKGYTAILMTSYLFLLDASQNKNTLMYHTNIGICSVVTVLYAVAVWTSTARHSFVQRTPLPHTPTLLTELQAFL